MGFVCAAGMRLARTTLMEIWIEARSWSGWHSRNDTAAQRLFKAFRLEEHGCYAITGHTQLSWPACGA